MFGQESVTLTRWERPHQRNWTYYDGEENDMCLVSISLNWN